MKTITLLFLGLSLTLIGYSQVSKTVNVATAGGLLSALTSTELTTVTNLTVTGTIDARDFLTLNSKMKVLAVLDMGGVTIAAYTGTLGTAGTDTTEYPANTIPEAAFRYKRSLTSVALTSSLISIGEKAFYLCEGLLSISLPASLTSIGESSFANCNSLTSLNIPSSVTDIGFWAFNYSKISIVVDSNNPNYSSIDGILFNKTQTILLYCPITRTGIYDIPQTVTSIEDYAFDGCVDLTSVTIPSSVTAIGNGAFYICTALTTVNLLQPSSITSIGNFTFYNCSNLASIDIPSSVTSIGNSAFYKCSRLNSIYIPSSVSSIGINAFAEIGGLITIDPDNQNYASIDGILFNKTLTTLIQCPVSKTDDYIIPQSVTAIKKNAFYCCASLTSVIIPSSVTAIGSGAFYKCTGLTSVAIPDVDTIQSSTFYGCTGLTSVTLPTSVVVIGPFAFYNCTSLTSVTLPASVTVIGTYAFNKCTSVTSVNIPPSVKEIGVSAFEDCKSLTSVTIPSSVTKIEGYTFKGCIGLLSVSISSSVISIGSSAFDGCSSLTAVNIPELVTSIGQYAFYDCSGLTTIQIPRLVNSIGKYAFYGCGGLSAIYANATIPVDLSSAFNVFKYVNKTTCILYVPAGAKSVYQSADQWKDFENIVEFATGLQAKEIPAISLLPNPFTDGFWISGLAGFAKITIIDLNGKIQFMKQGVGNEYISVTALPIGIYIVKINTGKGIIEKKMVKL